MRVWELIKTYIVLNKYKIAILLVSIALAFVGISPLGDGEGGAIPIDDPLPF